MKVKEAMDAAVPGQRVEVVATDAGFARDASAWCHTTGNRLIENRSRKAAIPYFWRRETAFVRPKMAEMAVVERR